MMVFERVARPAATSVGAGGTPTPWLQRQCACGGGTRCTGCDDDERLQKKASPGLAGLAMGAANDPLEHEADQAADQALAGRAVQIGAAQAPALQRREAPAAAGTHAAPDAVSTTLAAAGRPLDAAARGWAEERFGHSFASVRVHDDAQARRSAAAVGARAYTVGSHVVFGAGGIDTHSLEGRRLLAHELAHVVQQRGARPLLQRQAQGGAAPGGKTDVAIVLTDSAQDMAEGGAYAPRVLRVTSVADAAAQLKALGVPVGRLFVVSHSNASGTLQFVGASGAVTMVPIRTLAGALKGLVQDLDFRGCEVGKAADELEGARAAAGAQSAAGSSCPTITAHAAPLTVDGVPMVERSQLPSDPVARSQLDGALLQKLAQLRTDDGRSVQRCIQALGRNEMPGPATLPKLWQAYWANKGNLIADWASPENNRNWQTGSICIKHMTAKTQPCARVEKKATPP
jgi:Domain of unknown function (DUF4157)